MAVHNGINVNNLPFEDRYYPPDPRRKKRENLTVIDRLVCAVCGAFMGSVLWTFGYLMLLSANMKASARQAPAAKARVDPIDRLPPFWWGSFTAVGFGLFGSVAGAERMMDGFDRLLRVELEIGRAVNRS